MLVVFKILKTLKKAGLAIPLAVAAVLGAVLAVLFEAVAVTGVAGVALLAGGVLLAARGRENGVRAAVAAVRSRVVTSPGLVALAFAAASASWPLAVARRELGLGWELPAAFAAAVLAVLLVRHLATPAAGKVAAEPVEEPAAGEVEVEVGPVEETADDEDPDEVVVAALAETPGDEALAEREEAAR